jgi:hypothetical protein
MCIWQVSVNKCNHRPFDQYFSLNVVDNCPWRHGGPANLGGLPSDTQPHSFRLLQRRRTCSRPPVQKPQSSAAWSWRIRANFPHDAHSQSVHELVSNRFILSLEVHQKSLISQILPFFFQPRHVQLLCIGKKSLAYQGHSRSSGQHEATWGY